MTERLQKIFFSIPNAKVFADIGCDHGYIAKAMLESGKCEKVIVSDISEKCLNKARELLSENIANGSAESVVSDGFDKVFGVDVALIAGMGGSEIVGILSDKKYGFIPKRFVFQPMHDGEKLRRYILANEGYIERDFTFKDGKYYEVLVGGRRKKDAPVQSYTEAEYEFGKENLETMPVAFVERINKLKGNIEKYLNEPNLQEESRVELLRRKERLQGVLCGEIK